MSVRAKFRCASKKPYENAPEIVDVTFHAVADTEGSNAQWSKWTPAGQLTMQVTNPGAHEQFDVGKEYFLDLTPA